MPILVFFIPFILLLYFSYFTPFYVISQEETHVLVQSVTKFGSIFYHVPLLVHCVCSANKALVRALYVMIDDNHSVVIIIEKIQSHGREERREGRESGREKEERRKGEKGVINFCLYFKTNFFYCVNTILRV